MGVCIAGPNKQLVESGAYILVKIRLYKHENISFVHITRIVKPRSTNGGHSPPEQYYGLNPSIQPSKIRFSGCIDGRGPY